MTLIAILITIVIERTVESLRKYRRFGWFHAYADRAVKWCTTRKLKGPATILIVMLGPILAVMLINVAFHDALLGLLTLLFSVVVLFMCFGPEDLDNQVDDFLQAWERQDEDAAREAAAVILGKAPPESRAGLQQALVERILLESNERLLAPLFWFTVFSVLGSGPLGAVLYRLACVLRTKYVDNELGAASKRLHDILAWIPAYLSALALAMAGSFVDALHAWRERSPQWRDNWQEAVEGAVLAGGLGALQIHEQPADDDTLTVEDVHDQVRSAMGLTLRALVINVVLIALVTLVFSSMG